MQWTSFCTFFVFIDSSCNTCLDVICIHPLPYSFTVEWNCFVNKQSLRAICTIGQHNKGHIQHNANINELSSSHNSMLEVPSGIQSES